MHQSISTPSVHALLSACLAPLVLSAEIFTGARAIVSPMAPTPLSGHEVAHRTHLWQVLIFLFFVSVPHDLVDAEVGLVSITQANGTTSPANLLHYNTVVKIAETCTSVFLYVREGEGGEGGEGGERGEGGEGRRGRREEEGMEKEGMEKEEKTGGREKERMEGGGRTEKGGGRREEGGGRREKGGGRREKGGGRRKKRGGRRREEEGGGVKREK